MHKVNAFFFVDVKLEPAESRLDYVALDMVTSR